jgi:outer membrane protein assembly factor BamB
VTRGQVLAGGHGFGVVEVASAGAIAWRRRIAGSATCFAVSGRTVYLGGSLRDGFTAVGGRRRNDLAAVRLPAGDLESWSPSVARYVDVLALAVSGPTVLVGGSFRAARG